MHTISRKTVIASAVALITGSAGALAGQDRSASFGKADRDRNGSVSFQEADDALGIDRKLFSAADVDRDDTLKLRWKAIDNDDDQRIDRVEFSAFEKDSGN